MDQSALLEIADRIYSVPLSDFTPTRDGRAREIKGSESELAAAVKALKKPTTAAWVLNLLVRRESDQIAQVLSVGAALRAAQNAMEAGELRALTRQRRQVTAAVTLQARQLAAEEGLRVTEAVAVQVEETLTAALVDPACGRALSSGMLVMALRTTGIEPIAPSVLARSVALPGALGFTATPRAASRPGPPDLHVVPDPDRQVKARAAAEERLADAERVLAAAVADVERLDEERNRLQARSLQIGAESEELRRRLDALEEEGEAVDEQLAELGEDRDEAGAEVRRTTAERERAHLALEGLRS